jgi:hypothetical protein
MSATFDDKDDPNKKNGKNPDPIKDPKNDPHLDPKKPK